jgi:hypothetical protein
MRIRYYLALAGIFAAYCVAGNSDLRVAQAQVQEKPLPKMGHCVVAENETVIGFWSSGSLHCKTMTGPRGRSTFYMHQLTKAPGSENQSEPTTKGD